MTTGSKPVGGTTTERGLDRVVFFTDAVVAIAITLLILPLVDSVPEAATAGDSVAEFLADNQAQILGFVISFVVTARLWQAHHSLFRHVRAHSPRLVNLSLFWAFTICVLPLATAIISEFDQDRLGVLFYIGTMMVSSATLSIITLVVYRNHAINDPAYPLARGQVIASFVTTALFGVALVAGILAISFWPIFVLTLAGPVVRIVSRRRADAATPPG